MFRAAPGAPARNPSYQQEGSRMDASLAIDLLSSIITSADPEVVAASIPLWMEMLATVVGSICGALVGRELKLDYLGVVALGLITGLGGGLLRDMILQVHNVYMIDQPMAIVASIAAGSAVFLFPGVIANQNRIINALDIIVLGLFSALGADKAVVYGFDPLVGVIMGFLTAVGGGMLRDVFIGQTPGCFKRGNLYATAAIAGSVTFLLLSGPAHIVKMVAMAACVVVTIAVRFISLKFDIQSPDDIDLGPVVAKPFKKVGDALSRQTTEYATRTNPLIEERRRRVEQELEEYQRRAEELSEREALRGKLRRPRRARDR